jgi:hypothetical protein
MNVWVNEYVDLKGQPSGRLLSFSPGLHIVLVGEAANCKPMHPVGTTCHKCRVPIQGRNIYPAPDDLRALSCSCLMVLFSASTFDSDWIIKHWRELRRMKAHAEAQLAAGRN